MAIDNTLYDSLENTYKKIKEYLDTTKLGREHSAMMMKHEALADLLETFDIEALEEQSKDIDTLHAQLDAITVVSVQIVKDLEAVDSALKVTNGLDEVFLKITNIKV
ncbi:MAG: hypothetical protein Q9M43_14915 [Sulfurimonas sp.]|nr:hypothetical protein [Sulfurimonas sp.]